MAGGAKVVLETVEGDRSRLTVRFESGARLALDSPSGEGGPSPVEAVLAALGGCTAMDVISILRKKRQRVTGYEVLVQGERRQEHPRIYTRIEVIHRVTGHELSPEAVAEAIRRSDTRYCSVHAQMEGTAEISSRFEIVPA
jgi:putative redox protein